MLHKKPKYYASSAVANFTHYKLNGSDNVVSKDLLLHNRHTEWAIALAAPTFRPVLLALLCLALQDIGYHGNGPDILLPHQAPEVCDGLW